MMRGLHPCRNGFVLCVTLAFGLLVTALAPRAVAAPDSAGVVPARFTAFAVDLNRGRSAPLDLSVSRWSPAADAERLSSAIDEGGTDALVRALDHMPKVGWFRTTGSIGIDVQFASWTPGPDGGGRILLIGKRWLRFGEVVNSTRSSQYPLTVIELQVDRDGNGTGTLWPVARINYWDPRTQSVFVDNLTFQAVRLTEVRLSAALRTSR